MKRKLIILCCALFILSGFFIIQLPPPAINDKCKTIKSVKVLKVQDYTLKKPEYYENRILGTVLPYEKENQKDKTQDIKDLKLMGIAIIGNEKSAVVLLTRERKCITVKENDEINPYVVKKIEKKAIILAKNNKEYKLTITQDTSSCSTARYTPSIKTRTGKIVTTTSSPPHPIVQKRKTKRTKTFNRTARIISKSKTTPSRTKKPSFFSSTPQKTARPKSPIKNPFLEILRGRR